jgi:2,3-diketo-5-methylthio-1-phosphopentane phosphatase
MIGTVFLCDFDGTVAPHDIGAALVRRFSRGSDAEMKVLLDRWRAGEIGHRALTVAECSGLAVTEADALAFTRGFELDPGFAGFAREVGSSGGRLMIVSEGLDFYVRDLLERSGLGDLPWSANHARFESGGVVPEFPRADRGCGRCGNCKGAHVREHQSQGLEVVMVGDGFSDRCGARAADRVLARGDLLAWCREAGIPATPFASFSDVSAWARRWVDARARGVT